MEPFDKSRCDKEQKSLPKSPPKSHLAWYKKVKSIVCVTSARYFFFFFLLLFCKIFNRSLCLMIPYPTAKSTTWKAPQLLPSRNKKAVKEIRQFGYSESTNVLQCSCADMCYGTDRQAGRQCMRTYRSCREKRGMEWSQTRPPK